MAKGEKLTKLGNDLSDLGRLEKITAERGQKEKKGKKPSSQESNAVDTITMETMENIVPEQPEKIKARVASEKNQETAFKLKKEKGEIKPKAGWDKEEAKKVKKKVEKLMQGIFPRYREREDVTIEEKIRDIEMQIAELMKNMPKNTLEENKVTCDNLLEWSKDGEIIKYAKQNLEIIKKVEELQKQLEIAKETKEKTKNTNEIPKKHTLVTKEERENGENEEKIRKIVEVFKNKKIDEIIVSAGIKKIETEEEAESINKERRKTGLPEIKAGEFIPTFAQDLDSRGALEILNNLNKKSLEEIYSEGAKSTIINIRRGEKEPLEKTKGVRVFIDAGGEWINFEIDGETTTIRLDHHGAGKRGPTSGTKVMYEIMDKAELLKEKPEWLDKFVNFVNEFDNLTYLNEKGDKTFDEKYFKEQWPNSLYALARSMPFEALLDLFKTGKITDPSVPLTQEQLNGEIGKILIKKEQKIYKRDKNNKIIENEKGKKIVEKIKKIEIPLKKECEYKKGEVNQVINKLINAIQSNKRNKIETEKTSLGKIIVHDFLIIIDKKGKERINMIENYLGFIGTKALGYDTFINWNKKDKTFFINSNHPNLSKIVEKLNEIDPGCAKDVRGVMVFGKIKNLTEEQFLNIIKNPDIFKSEKKDLKTIQKTGENGEPVSDSDFNNFKNKKTVSNKILEMIAEKIINIWELSPREEAIYKGKTAEISKILEKRAGINPEKFSNIQQKQ